MNETPRSKLRRVIYWAFLFVVLVMLILALWAKYFWKSDSQTGNNQTPQNTEEVTSPDQKNDQSTDQTENEQTDNSSPTSDSEQDQADQNVIDGDFDASLEKNSDASTDYEDIEGGNFDDRNN